MSSDHPHLDDFADEARTFCHWATGEDGSAMKVVLALRRVSCLYSAALNLPPPFTEGMSDSLLEVEPTSGSVDLVTVRAGKLPMDYYWEIFDPIMELPDEPVVGSIVDDLGDIYRDVARGLVLFDSGDRSEALWEWSFNFRIHWGMHATNVIRILHSYLAREDPNELSKDV